MVLRQEEEHWQLKSRSLYLESGDHNSIFFRRQAKARVHKNNVREIIMEKGKKLSNFE
jgi:hypothetical protein